MPALRAELPDRAAPVTALLLGGAGFVGLNIAEALLARGRAVTVLDLHAAADRAPLSGARLHDELGWMARHGLESTPGDLDPWVRQHGTSLWRIA